MTKKQTIKSMMRFYILETLFVLLLTFVDRISKYYVNSLLHSNDAFVLIPNVLDIHYLQNTGSAFGLLNGQKAFFVFVAVVILLVIMFLYIRIPTVKHFFPLRLSLLAIFTGIMCNMTDRLLYDGVIDFIYLKFMNFPVFNIADIYITASAVSMISELLFLYKEKDFEFLYLKSHKYRELK